MRRKTTPENRNLKLHYEPYYNGLPVLTQPGPLIENYLARLYRTTMNALQRHPRTFAFRFDLYFPAHELVDEPFANACIQSFFRQLKAFIEADNACKNQQGSPGHSSDFRYHWALELTQALRPHFHCVALLNRDAYFTLGNFYSSQTNLYHRLITAWLTAIGAEPVWTEPSPLQGLVHIPRQDPRHHAWHEASGDLPIHEGMDWGTFHIFRDPTSTSGSGLDAFFLAASYLTKYATKPLGNQLHVFDGSQG